MVRQFPERSILDFSDLLEYENLTKEAHVIDASKLLAQAAKPSKAATSATQTIETLLVHGADIDARQANKLAELKYSGAKVSAISRLEDLAGVVAAYKSVGVLVLLVHSGPTMLSIRNKQFPLDDAKLLDLLSATQTSVKKKIVFEGCSIGRNPKALQFFASQLQAPIVEAFTWPHYLGFSKVAMSPNVKTLEEFRKKWDERADDDKQKPKVAYLDKLEKFIVAPPGGNGLNYYVSQPDSDDQNARTVWYEFLDPAELEGQKVVPRDGISIPSGDIKTKEIPKDLSLDDPDGELKKDGWRIRLQVIYL
jgi:hypothetical protein